MTIETTRVAAGGEAPPASGASSVAGGATPMRIYTQTSTPSTNPYDSN
jgi:hypothetical protein